MANPPPDRKQPEVEMVLDPATGQYTPRLKRNGQPKVVNRRPFASSGGTQRVAVVRPPVEPGPPDGATAEGSGDGWEVEYFCVVCGRPAQSGVDILPGILPPIPACPPHLGVAQFLHKFWNDNRKP